VESTAQVPPEPERRAAPAAWVAVIAHHPDPARIGHARVIAAGEELALGRRQDALGPGALDDETLSRDHARLRAGAAELHLRDAGSRNGTWVNGARVDQVGLRPGDVIELGAVLVQVIRPARPPRRTDEPELRAVSGAMAELVDELRRAAALEAPIVLAGETGTGKSALAAAVHRWSRRGPLVVVPCATLTPELIATELHGVAAAAYPGAVARPGRLAAADGGTLVLDGLDEAPPAVQAALRAFVDDRRIDARLIAITRAPGRLLPELAGRLERIVVRVPPLRERPEDIGVLARAAFARAGRTPARRLVLAMLRHPWPLNAGELEGVVERARLDAGDQDPVPLSPAVAAHLGAAEAPPATAGLRLARDGSWVQPAGGEAVSLRRRENLALLLRALAATHHQRPGAALSIDDLFRAGWPGQRIDPRAAAGRVYVALTALRNLGLRDVLVRTDDGYRFDPAQAIDIVD